MEDYIQRKTEELLTVIRKEIAMADGQFPTKPQITIYVNATAYKLLNNYALTNGTSTVFMNNVLNAQADCTVFGYDCWVINNNMHPLFRLAVTDKGRY